MQTILKSMHQRYRAYSQIGYRWQGIRAAFFQFVWLYRWATKRPDAADYHHSPANNPSHDSHKAVIAMRNALRRK